MFGLVPNLPFSLQYCPAPLSSMSSLAVLPSPPAQHVVTCSIAQLPCPAYHHLQYCPALLPSLSSLAVLPSSPAQHVVTCSIDQPSCPACRHLQYCPAPLPSLLSLAVLTSPPAQHVVTCSIAQLPCPACLHLKLYCPAKLGGGGEAGVWLKPTLYSNNDPTHSLADTDTCTHQDCTFARI